MTAPDRECAPIYRFPLTGSREYLEDLVGPLPHSRAGIEAAARRFGTLRLRSAAFWSAVRDLQSRPRTAGYPPRIFISYRWEDESIKQWCRRLAAYLRGRGYEVLLDLENLAADLGPGGIYIPAYVARLVDAHLVLRVITGPYVQGLPREWLLAEDQLMKLMTETGCAIAHVLLRDGTEPTDWGRHGTVDLRDAPEEFIRLDALLPPYRGLTLPAAIEEELVDVLARCRDLCAAGQPAAVLELLADRPDLAETFEVRQTIAHALLALDQPRQAADAAGSMAQLHGRPTVETTVDVALLLEEAGRPRDALRLTTRLIGLPTSLQPRIRRMAGSLLEDLGAPDAALRQLRYALRRPETGKDPKLGSDLHNMIGHVLLFGLGDPQAALSHFTSGAALDPANQHLVTNQLVALMTLGRVAEAREVVRAWQKLATLISPLHRVIEAISAGADVRAPIVVERAPKPTHVCDICGVAYRVARGAVLCATCTAISPDHGTWRCPYCSATARSPIGLLADAAACPVCREGSVTPVA